MNERGAAAALTWLRADPRRLDLFIAALTVGLGSLMIWSAPEEYDIGWPEVAAAIGAFGMLVVRRRSPSVLLVIALVWTAVHAAVLQRPTPMIFAILVLVGTVCVRLDRWRAIALGVAIAISLYLTGLISNDAELGDARAVIGIAWTAGAVGIADAIRSWRTYRESADAQIRSAVLAADAQTRQQVSEERLTIARELHDLLAHNMSVMNVHTGAALHLLRTDPDQSEVSLTAARDAGRSILDELGELLSVLRHDGSDTPMSSLPTIEELPDLVETMRSAGLTINWTRSGIPRTLAPAVSLAGYRITQEALTNAAKHGPGEADLLTEWDATGLAIQIANDRTPQDGTGSGHGLIGMRERASVNGGRFATRSDGPRFIVDAWLPAATDQEATA